MENLSPVTAVSVNKKDKKSKGTLKAFLASDLAGCAVASISLGSFMGVESTQKELNKAQIDIVNNAVDNVLNNTTNLGKKGVKIKNYTTPMLNLFVPEQIADGKNACFLNRDGILGSKNTVVVNRQKAPMFAFHELGHAFNFNNTSFWKIMQKIRIPCMGLALVFALFPAFTKGEKEAEGQELTKGQKAKNTLRKASPFLAFGAMLPVLGEEAMASIRGCAWAKQLLDKNLYKKVLKLNTIAYTSYFITALSFGVMAYVGKIVKDSFNYLKV